MIMLHTKNSDGYPVTFMVRNIVAIMKRKDNETCIYTTDGEYYFVSEPYYTILKKLGGE